MTLTLTALPVSATMVDPEVHIKRFGYHETRVSSNERFYVFYESSSSRVKELESEIADSPKHETVYQTCDFLRGLAKAKLIEDRGVAIDVAVVNHGYSGATLSCALKYMYGDQIGTQLVFAKKVRTAMYLVFVTDDRSTEKKPLSSPIKSRRDQLPVPSKRFNVSDGFVIDRQQKLAFSLCLLGQQWKNGSCTGSAEKLNYDEVFSPSSLKRLSPYRLPTLEEITDLYGYYPGNENRVFPRGQCPSKYWTSSAVEDGSPIVVQYCIEILGRKPPQFTTVYGESEKGAKAYVRPVREAREFELQ